jgi:hypothetical protein
MTKFVLGLVSGIAITLAFQYAYDYYSHKRLSDLPDEAYLLEIAPLELERNLEGAEFLDASVGSSEAPVNYVYDVLYDVSLRYHKDGEIRSLVMQFGRSGDTWIVPNKTDWVIRDDNAAVEYIPKTEESNATVIK